MKRISLIALIPAIAVIATAASSDEKSSDLSPRDRLKTLDWLEGSWKGAHERGTWEACYTSAEAGVILSANKEVKFGRVVMIEFERFDVMDDDVVVVPYPFGKPSVPFKLVNHDPKSKRAEFTNPEHDFPKRIVYERTSKKTLEILVEGAQGGREISMTLKLKKQ